MDSLDHDTSCHIEIILHQCPRFLGFLLPKPDRLSISVLLLFMLRMPVCLMLRLMHLILQFGASPELGFDVWFASISKRQNHTK